MEIFLLKLVRLKTQRILSTNVEIYDRILHTLVSSVIILTYRIFKDTLPKKRKPCYSFIYMILEIVGKSVENHSISNSYTFNSYVRLF